jgi:2-polyprenyl-3-methyl-5-hydroxy-6-metoxy-1,4-benzoquinol methylase
MLSSCTTQEYTSSLNKWDTSTGTLPDSKSEIRFSKNMTRRLKVASYYLPKSFSAPLLLDVGCSSGSLLKVAKKIGFDVQGVETAEQAVQTARNQGFKVFQGKLEEAKFENESFDLIILFELIEHIKDPKDLLYECFRILKRGGIVVLNTPNQDSWTASFMKEKWGGFSLVDMGGHISFFSPKSITTLADQVGLKLSYLETRNVSFYYKEYTNKLVYKAFKLLSEALSYPARFFNKGHDLFVILKKK